MRTLLKHIVAHTYKPLLTKYLSKTRLYQYEDIRLEIPSEVFHPGFFFSTRLLLNYINRIPLQGKKFLELGCGSGLISIIAAKNGAKVTAIDINPVAVQFLKTNSKFNGVKLEIIQSDLFNDIPQEQFDIIAINPPYYKKQPLTPQDYAWYCGEHGEYFSALFKDLKNYIHTNTEVLMVLFEGCDMTMINDFAAKNGFVLNCVYSKQNMLEKNYIFKIVKKHQSPAHHFLPAEFEQCYINLREKEGRIYKDEEVVHLPYINKEHAHYEEWKTRERSLKKLLKHVKQKSAKLDILEVGCGNGWLSAQLAAVTKGEVIGTDINNHELEQAKRVFHQLSNLSFIHCDIRNGMLGNKKFDMIVFAASIQYFSSLKEILNAALEHLTAKGEIHILDSHFYREEEVPAARQRTKDYYVSIGSEDLANYYFHHSMEDLNLYRYKILQNPYAWRSKLSANKNSFHWIVIK